MDLNELAESATQVIRVGDAPMQNYRLEAGSTTNAEQIGTDEFPQYGEFIDVTALDADGNDLGPRWVECPAGLAQALLDAQVTPGEAFAITTAAKDDDGAWRFEVARLDL